MLCFGYICERSLSIPCVAPDTTMPDTALQPRTGHLVAVFALLISSVGGFAPQTHGRYHHPGAAAPEGAGSSLLRSRRASLNRCGRCQQRGEWGGIGGQQLPGAFCQQGLAVGEATEQAATSLFSGRRGSIRQGWHGNPRSTSSMMALHFPKPPKMPKPPPPSSAPSGDKTPAGGKSAGKDASPTSKSAGSTGTSKREIALSPTSAGVSAAAKEGVVGSSTPVTKARSASAGHANATRADLNAGKVSEEPMNYVVLCRRCAKLRNAVASR